MSRPLRASRFVVPIALCVLLVPLVPEAGADTLCLKDGRVIEGKSMTREADSIRVKFTNGDVVVPQSMVLDVLIDSETADAAKSKAVAKRVAERKLYIEQVKLLAEWRNRKKESKAHFDFETTVPPHIYTRYRDLMEAYFTEFQKKWKVSQPKEGRLLVCFYGDEDTFHQVSAAPGNVLGYFRFVRPLELDIYYDRLDPERSEDVMFHEANHYLQKLLNVDVNMPHFPGEALAEYYGASSWDDKAKKLTVGLVQDDRMAEIQTDIASGDMMSLEKLLSTDRMYEHYTWGWSLVHFLMTKEKYSAKFQRFVTTLVNGKEVKREAHSFGNDRLFVVDPPEVQRIFMKCLDIKDKEALKGLEKEWHSYVKNDLKADSMRGYEKAGLKVLRTYPPRPILARMLLEKAIELGSRNARVHAELADMVASGAGGQDGNDKPDVQRAIELCKKAIELDPLVAESYADLGRLYEAHGKKEEGKKLLELARELDPDDPWLDLALRRFNK